MTSGQMGMPETAVTPANFLVLARRDAWAATRFALKRSRKKENALQRALPVGEKFSGRAYELTTLEKADIERLLAFLAEEKIAHLIE